MNGLKRVGPTKWQARIVWTDPKTGRKQDAIRTFDAPSERQAILKRALLAEELRGPGQSGKRLRLTDYSRSWLDGKLATIKHSTARTYAARLEGSILPALGHYYVDAIEHSDIIVWRDAQDAPADTVNGRLRVLKTLFADAVQELELSRNPCARVKALPRNVSTIEAIEGRGLTVEELRDVLAHVKTETPQWYPLVLLLALTGIRFGEATALHWDDVDLKTGFATIRRAQWHGVVSTPKASASRRAIPLPAELVKLLVARKREHTADKIYGHLPWVFHSETGGLYWTGVLSKPLRAALEAAGVTRDVPATHCLRHTYNNLLRQVATEAVRQAIVGHADAKIGERYSAISLDERRSASNAVVGRIRGG